MSALAVQAVFLEDTGSRIAKVLVSVEPTSVAVLIMAGVDMPATWEEKRRNSKYPTPMPERTIRMANPVTQTLGEKVIVFSIPQPEPRHR